MLEKEIKFIYDFNRNKIKSLGNFTTFTELSKTGLHPAILRFISADIDFLIFEDRQKLLKNSAFDYSGEKINHHFSLINDEIKKSKKLSADHVNKLILHAVTFSANFLLRPKWALSKFVFEDAPSKSTVEIRQILNYIYFYPYLKKIVNSYLTKKKLLSINQDDFKDLLTNIDKITIESSLPSVITTAVNSITEFFSIGSMGKDLISVNNLRIFFEEKELLPQLNALENHFGSDEKLKVNIKEALSILVNIDSADEIFVTEEKEPEESPASENIFEDDELQSTEDEITFEVSEKEKYFLSSFEEKPIVNIEEIDELTDKDILENEAPKNHEEQKTDEEFEEDEIISHDEYLPHDIKDENPKMLLPDDHYDSEEVEEKKENGKLNYKEDVFLEHHFKSEDPFEIIDGENHFKDLDHFDFLSEESQSQSFSKETEEVEDKKESPTFDNEENESESLYEIKNGNLLEEDDFEFKSEDKPDENIFDKLRIDDHFEEDEDDFLENQIDDNELIEEFKIEEEKTSSPIISKIEEDEDPLLFPAETVKEEEKPQIKEEKKDKFYDNSRTEAEQASGQRMIEMSDLLENKNMTKIIEVVFDYDMEDFANTIEKIAECSNKESALAVLKELFQTNRINPANKEAETLKEIISKYFDEH